jgi:acyl-CoA reductase-like NAD-dependent aldehyde dehydrogenase
MVLDFNAAKELKEPLPNLVNGKWAASGDTALPIMDPSEDRLVGYAQSATAEQVDAAVVAADAALRSGPWRTMGPAARARLMLKLADLLEQNVDTLASLETLNTGRPLAVTRAGDVMASAESLRYNAGWATKLNGATHTPTGPGEWHAYTVREPIGVAALIVPWNVPLAITVSKLGAALAAGCTVVIKPAELTPLTAIKLGELCIEAGFPPGVVNIVLGAGAVVGQALVDHPLVSKVSFTGSTAVGRTIVRSSAESFKRVSLELGGKSPVFIFDDADLDRAIPAAAMGIFVNTGQVCAAGSRLYVHEKVFDKVIEGVVAIAQGMHIGSGFDPATQLGPLISKTQRERVQDYVDSGLREGATLACGGAAAAGAGYFYKPTVMIGTRMDMRMVREEIFGPVLSTFRFDDSHSLDDLAALANDSVYGLAATVWTENLRKALALANRVTAGTVQINTLVPPNPAIPFGGFKHSGVGRENGREGVEAFTELKSVIAQLS